MIEKTLLVQSESINPYYNLATEAWLFDHLPANTMLFYLWQNHHTVVIGKNQNAYHECHLHAMEQDHCYLARRSTGGGAVYHDMGNLNFTFIANQADYDTNRNYAILQSALRTFDIEVTRSGRNDLEVKGKKISGSAFLHKDAKNMHHGTLLLDTDTEKMQRYLKTDVQKLSSKGVKSIPARVSNLKALNNNITIATLKKALIQAYEAEYRLSPSTAIISAEQLDPYLEHYHSWKYLYNRIPEYTFSLEERLSFGQTQLFVHLVNNYIMNVEVFSDTLDNTICERLHKAMCMTVIHEEAFQERTKQFAQEDPQLKQDMDHIWSMIKERYDTL